MSYEPNFSDPRIRNRALKALNFVELYVSKNKSNWISRDQIYAHLGDTSRPLGGYLRGLLLITVDDHYNMNTGQCKSYRRNTAGIMELKASLGISTAAIALAPKLEQQLITGDFEYTEKSNRIYNPIQCIPSDIRGSLLANHGYRYNYDIRAAAPTLLLQYAQQICPDFQAPALTNYIENRAAVRDQIAQQCEINANNVKFVVNALLNGAVISCYRDNQILVQLKYDYDAIRRLQHNDTVSAIRNDIREMWRVLRVTFPERYLTRCDGRQMRARLTGRQKSSLYRDLEKKCRGVITRYLRKHKIKFFWEHDGWKTNQGVNTGELIAQVRKQTGFVIQLDWRVFE